MLVIIRGAGDIATGIALRLHRSGYRLILTDLPQPTSIRRTVCFPRQSGAAAAQWKIRKPFWLIPRRKRWLLRSRAGSPC